MAKVRAFLLYQNPYFRLMNPKNLLYGALLGLILACNDDTSPTESQPLIEPLFACESGVAGPYACRGIDLMGHLSLEEMDATAGNDCWGWTDPATGKEYALMGLNNGTAFVDVTVANDPVYLGKLPTQTVSSVWRDIKVYRQYALIVADRAEDHGVQIFDLTRLRGVGAPTIFDADAHFDGLGSAHNIAVNEDSGYAFAVGASTHSGGPHFINLIDPLMPQDAGGYATSGYSHDGQVVTYQGPDSEYEGKEIFLGSNENEVVLVDVTDKDNPQLISRVQYAQTQYTHQGWLTEDHRFFLVGDELDELREGIPTRTLVFDIRDLDNPKVHFEYVAETDAIDHNGYVVGEEFYLASYTAGLRILDISQIENKQFTETAFFETHQEAPSGSGLIETMAVQFDEDHDNPLKGNNPLFDGAWSVYPYFDSGNIIVSDISGGLFVVRKQ